MSKSVLISCFLLSLAMSSSLRGPQPTPDTNYDDLQGFLTGFMTGYTGTGYNMSECLTPATQSQLDQILASTYGYIFTGKFSELKDTYEKFILSLANACGECGLTTVESSLKVGLQTKGKIWYEINLAYNSKKVEQAVESTITQMKAGQWTQAGQTLGQITDLLIPFESSPAKLGSFLDFNTASYQSWWKGLVSSLAISPKKQGPCAVFLLNFGNSTIPVFTDLTEIHDKQMKGFDTLFGDAAKTLTFIQTNYPSDICDFALLWSNVEEIFTKSGVIELASRYASKASLINSSVTNIKNCDLNAYACGQGYGNVVKYMLNWAIN